MRSFIFATHYLVEYKVLQALKRERMTRSSIICEHSWWGGGCCGMRKEEMDELVVDINVIIQYRIGLSRVKM